MLTHAHNGTQVHTVAQGHNFHTQTQQDDKATVTYFSGFQKDLSLLLILPLLLDSLQLLKEAKLRANVCRLLVALIVLTSR